MNFFENLKFNYYMNQRSTSWKIYITLSIIIFIIMLVKDIREYYKNKNNDNLPLSFTGAIIISSIVSFGTAALISLFVILFFQMDESYFQENITSKYFNNIEVIEEYDLLEYKDNIYLKETNEEYKLQYIKNDKWVEESFEKTQEINSEEKITKDNYKDIIKEGDNCKIIYDGKKKIIKTKINTNIEKFDNKFSKYIYEIHI